MDVPFQLLASGSRSDSAVKNVDMGSGARHVQGESLPMIPSEALKGLDRFYDAALGRNRRVRTRRALWQRIIKRREEGK
jgi:hypothetical protein